MTRNIYIYITGVAYLLKGEKVSCKYSNKRNVKTKVNGFQTVTALKEEGFLEYPPARSEKKIIQSLARNKHFLRLSLLSLFMILTSP